MATKKPDSTANEIYRDATLRHQIGVRRYTAGLMKEIIELLSKADADLSDKLNSRLPKFAGLDDLTSQRWQQLIEDIRGARSVALEEVRKMAEAQLKEFAGLEGAREASLIQTSIPVLINFAQVTLEQLEAAVTSKPFQGGLLNDWFDALKASDQVRLERAIQLGVIEGQTTADIVRRVVGTKAESYADGILSITRRDATTIVRTAVNHVSNSARETVWAENSDIIQALIWTATLDGRTSSTCRARDGKADVVGDNPLPPGLSPLSPAGARPPAHMNCRSVMVAYINGAGLVGNRPFVVDTRTPDGRRIDFEDEAAASGRTVKQVRDDWVAKNIGQVPAATTYQEFLKRQSAEFQDAVLGKKKGLLFRKGELTVDNFVDRNGNELTLGQLAKTRPEAFRLAGLDPNEV